MVVIFIVHFNQLFSLFSIAKKSNKTELFNPALLFLLSLTVFLFLFPFNQERRLIQFRGTAVHMFHSTCVLCLFLGHVLAFSCELIVQSGNTQVTIVQPWAFVHPTTKRWRTIWLLWQHVTVVEFPPYVYITQYLFGDRTHVQVTGWKHQPLEISQSFQLSYRTS